MKDSTARATLDTMELVLIVLVSVVQAAGFYQYELKLNTSPDINECANSSGGCEQKCTNTPGSFFCVCDEGFLLDVDGVSCLAGEWVHT